MPADDDSDPLPQPWEKPQQEQEEEDESGGYSGDGTNTGDVLNAAVKNRTGYIGFRINTGSTLAGDQINFTKVNASIRF